MRFIKMKNFDRVYIEKQKMNNNKTLLITYNRLNI